MIALDSRKTKSMSEPKQIMHARPIQQRSQAYAIGRAMLDVAIRSPESEKANLIGLASMQGDTRLEELIDRATGRDHWFSGQCIEGTAYLRVTDNIGFVGSQTAEDFLKALGDSPNVELFVDSCGGDTDLALRLSKLLVSRNTTASVVNKCYSAASILYLSANRRLIEADAKIMFHQAVTTTVGGEERHRMSIRMLGKLHSRLVDFVCARTHQPPAVVKEWFVEGRDKWFTAQEAIAAGIAHEIILPAVCGHCFPQASPPGPATGSGGDFPDERLVFDLLRAAGRIEVKDKAACG
jgi:ATP-dependent protease ClpP protease subunit